MNFRTSPSSMATTPIRTAIDDAFEARRHMMDAVAIYGNGYDDLRDGAICAIALGRAAYWTTSSYSAARTVDLPFALHRGLTIADALEEAFPAHHAAGREAALDTLVPLNRKAAIALSNAYAKFGSWIDEEELEMRALRDTRKTAIREPLTYANYLANKGQI